MQKKTSGFKVFSHAVKRVFRSRNIIIISDHKIDHVPLNGVIQVLLLTGFLGFFSGVSYITGSYMAARSVITEKDRKIASTSMEKGRISEEIYELKQDLAHLSQNGTELNAYNKFIIAKHNGGSQGYDLALNSIPAVDNNMFGQNTGKLLDRISFLETRISEIQNESDHLVTAIRERTSKKTDYLEDVISMTGLDADNLENAMKSEKTDGGKKSASVIKSSLIPVDNASTKKDPIRKDENEGGPFIPYENSFFSNTEQSLLSNVDRLITLNEIVKKLPLSQPINDAQQMSPFGKRVDPFNRRLSMHPGIDLAGPVGARVFTTSDGVVVAAGRKPAYGNMVDVEHKFGIVTRYAHLSKILVNEGDHVTRGQSIGIQGSTGRSTGPHLHYEVRINDRPVNPINFLHAGEYVLEE